MNGGSRLSLLLPHEVLSMTTQEEIQHYIALDSFFKSLYFINKDWFLVREKLSAEQKKELFDLMLKVMTQMDKFKFKLIDIKQSVK